MEASIRYPEHFAPVAEEEMVYLTGGSILNDVVDGVTDVVDGAVGVTNSALGALGTIATVVGVCVLGVSYIWGIQQANTWLDHNGDGNLFTVGDSFLYDYRYDINDLIEEYQDRDVENILDYFNENAGAKAKLVSAVWTTEDVDGTLYGKVDLRLREELTEDELTAVKDWITGQNSDGAFENLEDHPIDSEDGKLSISLWHGGNDYFVSTRDELDEYIAQQNELKIGGM